MRFLFADFDGVLGVQGEVIFPQDRPLVLYGENVSGKSNIINALRYCMNPPGRGRRGSGYGEGKLPSKQEMLVDPLDEGSVTIYFVQGEELFKLEYRFSRSGSRISRQERLFITEGEVPSEDVPGSLRHVDWGSQDASGVRSIKETLEGKKVYPEILDVLIAPSNIANFSDAVSGDIVDVPELIQQEVEQRHERSDWYEERLDILKNVCEKQDEQLNERLGEQRESFLSHDFDAAGIPPDDAEEQFDAGADGLRSFRETVSQRQRDLPDVQQQVQEISGMVDRVQDQTEWIGAVVEALEDKEKLQDWVEMRPRFEVAAETVRGWEERLEGLPSAENIENVTEFSPPDTEELDLELLENGEEFQAGLAKLHEMQGQVERAVEIREDHGIPRGRLTARKEEMERLIASLDEPVTEPDGIDSVLFVDGDQAAVGIPETAVDALEEEPSYTDVASTPQVLQTEGNSDESLTDYRETVVERRDEIERAIGMRDDAKRMLSEFKREVPNTLAEARESLERKESYRDSKIEDTTTEWTSAYSTLCSEFDDIEQQELTFDDEAAVAESASHLEDAVATAKATVRGGLEEELSAFDDIEVPDEIETEALADLVSALERKEEELQAASEALDDIQSWIDQHLEEVQEIEEKLATARVTVDVAAMGTEVFREIKQKSDLSEIVDQLADSMETNVRATYDHIFAGESLEFSHVGDGDFRCTLNGEEITHPSGSQRAVMSFGIMLSLAKSFDLPILLDEAADRFDYIRLARFYDFITGVTSEEGIQTCLVMCKSKDIEEHDEVRDQMAEAEIYRLRGLNEVENKVQPSALDNIIGSS